MIFNFFNVPCKTISFYDNETDSYLGCRSRTLILHLVFTDRIRSDTRKDFVKKVFKKLLFYFLATHLIKGMFVRYLGSNFFQTFRPFRMATAQ